MGALLNCCAYLLSFSLVCVCVTHVRARLGLGAKLEEGSLLPSDVLMLLYNPAGKTNVKKYLAEFCYPQYRLQIRSAHQKARKREETSRIVGSQAFQKFMEHNVETMVAHADKGDVKEITGWHAEDDDFEASFMLTFKQDYPGRESFQWMNMFVLTHSATLLIGYFVTLAGGL